MNKKGKYEFFRSQINLPYNQFPLQNFITEHLYSYHTKSRLNKPNFGTSNYDYILNFYRPDLEQQAQVTNGKSMWL